MTDTYSLLLGFALAAAAVAGLLLIVSRWRPSAARASLAAAATALILDGASFAVHLLRDHHLGAPDDMTARQFLGEHPAFSSIAVASAVVLWLAFRTGIAQHRPQSPNRSHGLI